MFTPKVFLPSIILSTMLFSPVNFSSYTRQSSELLPPGGGGRIGVISQSQS